jgi:hypothetical protein
MPQADEKSKLSHFLDKAFEYLNQFAITLVMHRTAYEFIREKKPWRGMDRFGWMLVAIIGAGALLSYQFFKEFYHVIEEVQQSQMSFSASVANAFSLEKLQWAMQGSRKYLIMIVMELVVFYFIQKTLEIRIGRKPELTTKAFIDAEFRIIGSTVLAFVLETIAKVVVVKIGLGIIGFDFLDKPVSFLIQCYFLGFALIDNYHECFDLKLKESELRTRKTAVGVAVATGLVAQLLMYVPLVGAAIATMLGAVTATLAMERFAPVHEAEHLAIIAENSRKKNKKKQHTGRELAG